MQWKGDECQEIEWISATYHDPRRRQPLQQCRASTPGDVKIAFSMTRTCGTSLYSSRFVPTLTLVVCGSNSASPGGFPKTGIYAIFTHTKKWCCKKIGQPPVQLHYHCDNSTVARFFMDNSAATAFLNDGCTTAHLLSACDQNNTLLRCRTAILVRLAAWIDFRRDICKRWVPAEHQKFDIRQANKELCGTV